MNLKYLREERRLLNWKYLKAGLAALIIACTAVGAYALSVDQTRTMPKRFYQTEQSTYYRLTINYNDANIGLGQQFGALGQLAFINSINCYVTTAFNAVTTNVVTIGTTKASANEIVASGITAGTIGFYPLTTAAGLGLAATAAGDVTLWAKYAQTGTAATAGSVTCVIEFMPNNDM